MKPALPLALALLAALALPAQAQQRALRVPEGAAVVVPPRGGDPLPQSRAIPRARAADAEAWPSAGQDLGGPSAWVYVLVPLAAGAIAALATSLPGGGGGGGGGTTSGPVRTR